MFARDLGKTPHILQYGRTSATPPLDTCVLIVVHKKMTR